MNDDPLFGRCWILVVMVEMGFPWVVQSRLTSYVILNSVLYCLICHLTGVSGLYDFGPVGCAIKANFLCYSKQCIVLPYLSSYRCEWSV